MKIYILEDDYTHMGRLETTLQTLINKHQLHQVTIDSFADPQKLLDNVTEKGSHLLFFLDIEIRSNLTSGLDVGSELRKRDPYAVIVFVTTHSEFMPLTFQYQVKASEYISKELDNHSFEQRVEDILLSTYHHIGKERSEEVFTIHTPHIDLQVPFHELLYIETSQRSHQIIIYTTTETIELPLSLETIQKQEPKLFRCFRSTLVNPGNITSLNTSNKTITLKTGDTCLVSRDKIKKLKEILEG